MNTDAKGHGFILELKRKGRVLRLHEVENRKNQIEKEQALAEQNNVMQQVEAVLRHNQALQEQVHDQLERMASGNQPYIPDLVGNLHQVLDSVTKNVEAASAEKSDCEQRIRCLEEERLSLRSKKIRLKEMKEENISSISRERDAMQIEEALEQQLYMRRDQWTS